MKPSRKLLSLPILSLKEGQQIGYVKSLILSANTKSVAAIVVDPKGFFKDQRIIPYSRVVSVGDDAITVDRHSHVEKTSSVPELLDLIKDKLTIIGTKLVTETGKTLGTADEYYIDTKTGEITQIELSGGKLEGFLSGKAWLSTEYVITIGHDVIIAQKESENALTVADKGLNETLKSFVHSTSHLASETTQTISNYFKKGRSKSTAHLTPEKEPTIQVEDKPLPPKCEITPEIPETKDPLG